MAGSYKGAGRENKPLCGERVHEAPVIILLII